MNRKTVGSSMVLFLTAFIWGMSFVAQSKGMDFMHPFTFNGVRSLIAAAVLFTFALVTGRLRPDHLGEAGWKGNLKTGLLCGLVLTAASTLQQFGVKYTTVGKAGFITTLYIIFVPLAGIFFRRKVSVIVWFSACMAAVGMYLLCLTESFSLGMGDILVICCAVFYAVHIMVIDRFSPGTDSVLVSCIQFAVCGVVCGAGALIWGKPDMGQLMDGIWSLLYAGAMGGGVAYTLQIVGQKGVNPTVAALIMSLESVVATVAAWIAYKLHFLTTDQSMTARQVAGCIIVFTAVVLVQLPESWFGIGRKRPVDAE